MSPSPRSVFVLTLLAAIACGDDDDGAGATASGTASAGTGETSGATATDPDPTGDGSSPTASTGATASSTGSDPADTTDGTDESTGGVVAGPCEGPKPGPDNTGVPPGITLRPSGSITIEEDGAVVEGLDIQGSITVLADDVTIRNVRIRSGDYYPIRYFDEGNTGLVVEDSEIEGLSGDVTSGIAFANYTARRLNIHGGADGLKADANVLIEDCWIHDLSNGRGEHNDAVQSTGGKGVTIRHSVLEGASNAAVQTGDEGAATEDLTIECSWLYGGGYTLNIRGTGDTVPMNTAILDNRFGRDSAFGPWTIDDPNPTISGNVYDDDGEPIP